MESFQQQLTTDNKQLTTPTSLNGLISTPELIEQALKNGVDFGSSNPSLRLRYFVKLGIIPPPKRIVEHSTAAHKQPPKIVGYYPKETLDILVKIHNLKEKGYKYGRIKEHLITRKSVQTISSKPQPKIRQKSPAFKQNIQPKIKSPRFSIPRFNLFPNVGISEKDLEKKIRDHEQKLIRLLNPSSQNLSEFPQISGIKFAYLFKGLIIIIAATGLVSVAIISSKNYLSQILSNKEVAEKITTSNDLIGQVLAATSDTHRLYIDADTQVSGTTLFAENITAPNVLYGAVAGTGITVSAGQTPTIGLDTTGIVTSVNALAGNLTIKGSGSASVSSSGSTITISSSAITSEADTLATVTGRGASTSTALTFSGGLTLDGSTATTSDIFTITAGSITSGSALVATGPTSTGVTDHFFKLSSDIGSGAALIYAAPDFSGSAVTGYGLNITATDSTSSANTDYGIYSSLALTGNAAKTGYGIYSTVSSTSTTADRIFGVNSTVTAASGTTAYALYADAGTGTGTEYAGVFQNGNVGIGTAAPSQLLHLYKATADTAVSFESTGTASGTNSPSTAATDSGGEFISWTSPENILTLGGGEASVSLDNAQTSHYLKATGFGFSIPSSATITGIKLEIMGVQPTEFARYADATVMLVKEGNITGDNKGTSDGTTFSFISVYVPYPVTSTTDLWGTTWAPSDINAPNFGAALSMNCTDLLPNLGCNDQGSFNVGHMRITVYYYNVPWTIGSDYSDNNNFKISRSASLGTDDYLKFDANTTATTLTLGASGQVTLDASTTANATTSGVLDVNVTSLTNQNSGVNLSYTSTAAGATTAVTQYGIYSNFASSQAVTATSPTFNYYNNYGLTTKSGADNLTTGGTFNTYGTYSNAQNTSTDAGAAGTRNTYGGYFSAAGGTAGTTATYGIYATGGTSDNNYGIYIADQTGGTTDYGVYIAGADTAMLYFGEAPASASTAGLCWDNSGASAVTDCSSAPTDLAENFGTNDPTIEAGDIVVTEGEAYVAYGPRDGSFSTKARVVKSSLPYQTNALGIVSTNPNLTFADDELFSEEENPRPVSLAGRVPVKVSSENGPIQVGDYITSSSTAGVGMRASKAGRVIGMALGSFGSEGQSGNQATGLSGTQEPNSPSTEQPTEGTIIVFVNPTFYLGTNLASNGSLSSQLSTSEVENSYTSEVSLADNQINSDGTLNEKYQKQILTAEQIQRLVTAEVSRQLASSPIPDRDSSLVKPPEATDSAGLAQQTQQTLDELDELLSTSNLQLDTLAVTGNTNLAQTQVAGTFSQDGTLIIDYGKQINVLGLTLYLQNDPLAGCSAFSDSAFSDPVSKNSNETGSSCANGVLVDIGGGKLTVDKNGNLVTGGQLAAGSLKTKEIIVHTDEGSAQTVGSASIASGSAQTTISTRALKPNAKVIITLTSPSQGKVIFVSEKNEFEGFTVSVENGPPSSTITFDWLIINTTENSNSI